MYNILSIPNVLLALKQTEYTFERRWVTGGGGDGGGGGGFSWMVVRPTVEVIVLCSFHAKFSKVLLGIIFLSLNISSAFYQTFKSLQRKW